MHCSHSPYPSCLGYSPPHSLTLTCLPSCMLLTLPHCISPLQPQLSFCCFCCHCYNRLGSFSVTMGNELSHLLLTSVRCGLQSCCMYSHGTSCPWTKCPCKPVWATCRIGSMRNKLRLCKTGTYICISLSAGWAECYDKDLHDWFYLFLLVLILESLWLTLFISTGLMPHCSWYMTYPDLLLWLRAGISLLCCSLWYSMTHIVWCLVMSIVCESIVLYCI